MKIVAFILFALEEVVVATSSLGIVTLLEIRWAKSLGLVEKNATIEEAAKQISIARLVYRRYGPREDYENEKANLQVKAKVLGLPREFSSKLIDEFLSLKAFMKERFGNNKENYIKWRQEELKKENFRLLKVYKPRTYN